VSPTSDEARILADVFGFHELAVEDALSPTHHPKVEPYDGYLYLILHGIDFEEAQHRFATHDVDFFLGPNYLVTVHDGTSRSVARMRELCPRNEQILAEGPVGLLYRIIDAMVDNYGPEVDKLEDRLDEVEEEVFESPRVVLLRRILDLKRDVASLRRVTLPQRDAVARLARREFPLITEAMAYRFRDVHDHLVRMADEATNFQDRTTSLLDAHLSNQSNQLSHTMRILTVIATIFMPLTLLTGLFGMNVELPGLVMTGWLGFWEIAGAMVVIAAVMLWVFRTRDWI
jgi:magnesium transporter